MRLTRVGGVVLAFSALVSPCFASGKDSQALQSAKALFKRYVDLEQAYDVAVVDLYSDEALISNRRTYATGQVRELTIPAPQYKELLRKVMPLGKARGDRSTYSDCRYEEVGERVRIRCQRFSEAKKYTSPLMFR